MWGRAREGLVGVKWEERWRGILGPVSLQLETGEQNGEGIREDGNAAENVHNLGQTAVEIKLLLLSGLSPTEAVVRKSCAVLEHRLEDTRLFRRLTRS